MLLKVQQGRTKKYVKLEEVSFSDFINAVQQKFLIPEDKVLKVADEQGIEVDENVFPELATEAMCFVISTDDEWDSDMASLLVLLHLLTPQPAGRKRPKKISVIEATDHLVKFQKSCQSLEDHLMTTEGNPQPYLTFVGMYPGKNLRLKCGQVGCCLQFSSYSGFRRHLIKIHASSDNTCVPPETPSSHDSQQHNNSQCLNDGTPSTSSQIIEAGPSVSTHSKDMCV
ncbi:uncharacterized protein LOC127353781 [Dicentrarchus labrax]|uniref:uncharacterized protein LOC127353781 n=1 Tax=Dicentrarchus labrax TaxID=13489 RepID=UPI0021F61FEF|nr:uncharacterized protein LOC127353781 [Dicentrarchus labrax]